MLTTPNPSLEHIRRTVHLGPATDHVWLPRLRMHEGRPGAQPRRRVGIPDPPPSAPRPGLEARGPDVSPATMDGGKPRAGFDGISHADQRLAGTGAYADTQFSLEPPDQALCASDRYIVESVNTAVRARAIDGSPLSLVTPINQFFLLAPAINRVNQIFGDFTADPVCYYDHDTRRWFLTALQLDVDPATGDFAGPSSVLLAVSQTANPMDPWNLYKLITTNDGSAGTPTHANCPCLPDYPQIGADRFGFYITTNEFPLFADGFNGAQIYAMSKLALAAGAVPPAVVLYENVPYEEYGFTIQPARSPRGIYDFRFAGTAYFASSFDALADNRLTIFTLLNTQSLRSRSPRLDLRTMVVDTQTYVFPSPVVQRPGPAPLGESLGEPLNWLSANDVRLHPVVYFDGNLWAANNTAVTQPDGSERVGVAYYLIRLQPKLGETEARVKAQGYISVPGHDVWFPGIAVNIWGEGAIVMSLSGPDYYPSAAYVRINDRGVSPLRVAAEGAAPSDGFTGYAVYGGSGVARWGDYSAAVATPSGDIWMAVEYVPDTPRTSFANCSGLQKAASLARAVLGGP